MDGEKRWWRGGEEERKMEGVRYVLGCQMETHLSRMSQSSPPHFVRYFSVLKPPKATQSDL